MNDVISLSKQLINITSVSPEDNGCLELIIPRLEKLGFNIEIITANNASNLWARYGNSSPVICFLGHTDVVPPGPLEKWSSPPFEATEKNNLLYGRGAADMKTAVAAQVIAIEAFIHQHPDFKGSVALLLTSAEEDFCELGTPKVVEYLQQTQQKIDYCIVGEPSCSELLGDTIKVGRRGSLHGKLIIYGKQGHIAYPHLASNPIHNACAALAQLTKTVWDKGNADFPPTSFQIYNIQAGVGADNVIPGELHVGFNFRFSPESTEHQLKQVVTDILTQYQLHYEITWHLSGLPFHCQDQTFINICKSAITSVTQQIPQLSTAGGTSDGRFIAPLGVNIIEFGVLNKTIHQVNEHCAIADIENLARIYQQILINFFHEK
jgi:succinyl-diaminopimelate desuccinylase